VGVDNKFEDQMERGRAALEAARQASEPSPEDVARKVRLDAFEKKLHEAAMGALDRLTDRDAGSVLAAEDALKKEVDSPSRKVKGHPASTDNETRQVAVQPKLTKGRRERGPDYETSRQRVALEDILRYELGTIKSKTENFTTPDQIRKEFPDFKLWKILSPKEQQQLLNEEFKPKAYARTLVVRNFGLTNTETIKKDRQKLRRANK
jgi:hypothetical protein